MRPTDTSQALARPNALKTLSKLQNHRSQYYERDGLKIMQQQAGHSWASTTAVYTTVGQDARNRMLRSALDRAFEADGRNRT
jgi:hypothetical protein